MSVYEGCFPLGLGTARFPVSGPEDDVGLKRSVDLVLRALESGVNYIDTGHSYSAGMASRILKDAFRRTARPFSVTVKVQYGEDRTADDAVKRVRQHLSAMGLLKAQFFICWSIGSCEDFRHIMAPGGIYEGALRLRDDGIIDHICASLHAPPADMVRIIESGAFEGVTVSYSLLNAVQMRPVLDAAARRGVGVAVMNPLGGGLIAQNRNYFSFACGREDGGNTVHAALRFARAHPAADIVLGGVSSLEELEDSLGVLSAPDPETPQARMERVMAKVSDLKGFCTGCKYCAGCPQGIPTYALMQARNALLFDPAAAYNRQGPEELLYNLQIFRKLYYDDSWTPDSGKNPCIGCGKCEAVCTQRLEIIRGVADVYRRAEETGYTEKARRERLRELLYEKEYRRVGLYPNSNFSKKIMDLYQTHFGDAAFEWMLFNSDRTVRGTLEEGLPIHHPDEIPELRPDMMLICSYRYEDDIAEMLRPYERQGLRVERLHRDGEVPWIF